MAEPQQLPACSACRDAAAMLTVLAEWVEESLAGGDPAKWVAQQAALAARAMASPAGPLGHDAAPAIGMTVGDDVTMLLRLRPEPLAPRARWGRRAARYIRHWAMRAGAD